MQNAPPSMPACSGSSATPRGGGMGEDRPCEIVDGGTKKRVIFFEYPHSGQAAASNRQRATQSALFNLPCDKHIEGEWITLPCRYRTLLRQ